MLEPAKQKFGTNISLFFFWGGGGSKLVNDNVIQCYTF
jgi:hypothetical protein